MGMRRNNRFLTDFLGQTFFLDRFLNKYCGLKSKQDIIGKLVDSVAHWSSLLCGRWHILKATTSKQMRNGRKCRKKFMKAEKHKSTLANRETPFEIFHERKGALTNHCRSHIYHGAGLASLEETPKVFFFSTAAL